MMHGTMNIKHVEDTIIQVNINVSVCILLFLIKYTYVCHNARFDTRKV